VKAQQAEEKLMAGRQAPLEWDLVFTRPTGEPYHQKFINNELQRVWPGFSAHKLRHTLDTLLHAAGTDVKSIQQLMGHSSSQITLDIYVHPQEDALLDAVDALDG
jgi:integrase